MGRPRDRQQAQARRAREDLDKGLKRRDAGLAVESWLGLPAEERAPLLERVAGVLRDELERLARDRGGQQARLLALAAHVAAEPALLAGRRDLHWVLFAAAVRARDLGRARRLYAPLQEEITARAPAMHAWVSAFLDGGGQIAPEAAAGLPPLPGPDPRLGHDAARPRVKLPTPRSAEEAERSVRLLFVLEGRPAALREVLLGWIQEVPALAPALARVAGPLAARDALRRVQAGQGAGLVLVLLGELVRWAGEELAADVFLGFRLASAALHRRASDPEALRAFASLATAVSTYPEHRPAVVAQAIELPVPETWEAGLKVQLDLYGALLSAPGVPDVRLWARALLLYSRSQESERDILREPPSFLTVALSRLLEERDGAPLFEWMMQDAEPHVLSTVLRGIGEGLPLELGEQVLEKGFARQGEEQVRAMTRLLTYLVQRRVLSRASMTSEEFRLVRGATWGDLAEIMDQVDAAGYPVPDELYDTVDEADPGERLPQEMGSLYLMMRSALRGGAPMLERQRALLRRFQEQALPYSHEIFSLACDAAGSSQEALRIAERHLSGTQAIEARIHVMQALYEREHNEAYEQVKDRMLSEYEADAPALSRALHLVLGSEGPMQLRRELSAAFLAADQAYQGERDERYEMMRSMAQLYAPRSRKPKAKTPKAKTVKTPRAKAPAKTVKTPKTPRAKTPKAAADQAPAKTPRAKAPAKTARTPKVAADQAPVQEAAAPEQMDLPEVHK